MADPYVAEIRAFGFNFAPTDWAQCNGQLIAISQNAALFSLIGTTFGGNGTANFALPNLQDRIAVGAGQKPGYQDWVLGEMQGEPSHTLLITEIPSHNHPLNARVVTSGATAAPSNSAYPGQPTRGHGYSAAPSTTLAQNAVGLNGNTLPHDNLQPVQVLNYCIALYGVFPPRN